MKTALKLSLIAFGFGVAIFSTYSSGFAIKVSKISSGFCKGDENRNCALTKDSIQLCGYWVEN